MPDNIAEALSAIKDAQIRELIATRNKPMLTALQMCIDELEPFQERRPDVQTAIRCARKAIALETEFQNSA